LAACVLLLGLVRDVLATVFLLRTVFTVWSKRWSAPWIGSPSEWIAQ
jgi:hypothetical protein